MSEASLRFKSRFKNEYLSVSRIKKYEQCPMAFAFAYIEKRDRGSSEAAEFGKLLHAALENIYNWIVAEEYTGPITDERIIEEYAGAFEKSEVTGTPLYQEGLAIIRNYFRLHPVVSHTRVLAIEKKFQIKIHGYTVLGYIDRIDRVDAETVEIIDYKSNRMFFTREDLDTDLQMSIYGIAVKALWPWIKEVRFGFDMLRHNVRQHAFRTDEQLRDAADYLAAMADRIESSERFEAKLNVLCAWCDHREYCSAYNAALEKGEQTLSYMVASSDMEKVCAERDRAAALAKIAYRRKDEMDAIILARLIKEGEFVQGGVRFKAAQRTDAKYDFHEAVEVLVEGLGLEERFVQEKIAGVVQKRIDSLIEASRLTSGKRQLLKAKLESTCDKVPQRPYVSARKVAERKGKKK